MPLRSLLSCTVLVVATLAPACVRAGDAPAETDAAAIALFESEIRPLLIEHCYQCHSAEAGKSEGGLRLDSKVGIRAGGDRGPAVVPGDPEASQLLIAVSHTDPDFKMPPRG